MDPETWPATKQVEMWTRRRQGGREVGSPEGPVDVRREGDPRVGGEVRRARTVQDRVGGARVAEVRGVESALRGPDVSLEDGEVARGEVLPAVSVSGPEGTKGRAALEDGLDALGGRASPLGANDERHVDVGHLVEEQGHVDLREKAREPGDDEVLAP